MLPKFSASASTVGAVMRQSEIVKEATELSTAAIVHADQESAVPNVALQLLTLTV